MKTVVVGIGNDLSSDDGLGLEAIRLLRDCGLPPEVELIEGNTAGLELIELIAGTGRAILIDAILSGAEPGAIHRYSLPELPETGIFRLSLHGLGPVEAIRLGKMVRPEGMPEEIVFLGVEAADTRPFRVGLSDPVSRALPELIRKVREEVLR